MNTLGLVAHFTPPPEPPKACGPAEIAAVFRDRLGMGAALAGAAANLAVQMLESPLVAEVEQLREARRG